MSVAAYLSLGSNVGDRRANLDAAVASLAEAPGLSLRGVSTYHETAPVGGPSGQGAFLNAAAVVETTLGPRGVLASLQAIEAQSGRVRDVRWGERTLDVDLLIYGDQVIDEPGLIVPHPRMAVRRFVLAPLAEVAPGAVDPVTGRTMLDLLANLDRRPSFVCLSWLPTEVFRRVAEGLGAVGLFDGTLSDRSYAFRRDDLGGDHDFFAILAQKTSEFEARRWSPKVWGDRWIISDFWIHHLAQDAGFWVAPEDLGRWGEAFVESVEEVIRPTFLVGPPDSLGQMRAWGADRIRNAPPRRRSNSRDLPGVTTTRRDSSGRGDPDQIPTAARDGPALLDVVVREILAACEASRT